MKKLIIVTGMIMLAACVTVRKGAIPPEGPLSPSETQDQLILAALWYQQPRQSEGTTAREKLLKMLKKF
jgi:hypothetical protein